MSTSQPITADSTPDYDDWGWDEHWGCDEWVQWWGALSARHGPRVADQKWGKAWLDGLSRAADGLGKAPGSGWVADAVPVGCRTFNRDFRDLIMRRPKLMSVIYRGPAGMLTTPLGAGHDLGRAAEGLGQAGKKLGAEAARNPIPFGLMVLGGLGLAAMMYLPKPRKR